MERLVFIVVVLVAQSTYAFPTKQENTVLTHHPDIDRNVSELIQSRGYPVEEHYVVTQDGYILNIQRIPHGKTNAEDILLDRPVVFLQHGLLMDSSNWILNSATDSLGYILADQGFDVWLGNIRGNIYSQRHVKMNPNQGEFWNFSWQEMAEYDLPAMIDYVLSQTDQSHLFYVGHSQGTLMGFTGFSSNKKLANKIKTFFALAPVYTLGHCSDVVKTAAYALYPLEHVFQNDVNEEFTPVRMMKRLSEVGFCGGSTSEELCYKAGETLFGFDSSNINMCRIPTILAHFGTGTSLKNLVHFGQMVTSGKCQKYNYGYWTNVEKYGQLNPPEYRVEDMTTPTLLFSGSHDALADPMDVENLKGRVQNLLHFEEIQGWNHADFLFGQDAPQKLYSKIVATIKENSYL